MVLLSLLLIVHAFLWIFVAEWKLRRHRALTPRLLPAEHAPASESGIAVFVPARNEERAIRAAITSLLRQRGLGRYAVICANDHSTDGTGRILRRLKRGVMADRFAHFDVPELPQGWMGKCHGLYHAVKRAPKDAEFYLFTDADVIHAPDTVRRAHAHMVRENADLLAIVPRVDCVGFWENAVMPVLMHIGSLTINPANLNDPTRKDIAGIGAFCMLRRSMYEKWGGHRAIRGEVIDDMAMAFMTKRARGKMLLVRDPRAIHLRMYTDLASIISGFEKNMHTAIGGGFARTAAAATGFVIGHLLPLMVSVAALMIGGKGSGALALAGLGVAFLYGLLLVFRIRTVMKLTPWMVVVGYPLGVLLCGWIMVRSAWQGAVLGEVRWRGRVIKRPKQKVKLA